MIIQKGENDSLAMERKEEIQPVFLKSMDLLISSIHKNNNNNNNNNDFKNLICGLQLPREPHRSNETSSPDWQMAIIIIIIWLM